MYVVGTVLSNFPSVKNYFAVQSASEILKKCLGTDLQHNGF